MDPMYKVRQSLAASKTAPKTASKSSKPGPKPGPKKKLGKHHIRHKIAHDPYAYIDAPIVGLRGNVRCTNCFHLGHAPNASKICPVEVVNRAVISSINRTKSSWTRMQWELQTLYESLKSVIQQMEEEDDGEGLAQNKIRWVVAEFEKLNPTTGRPLDQGKSDITNSCLLTGVNGDDSAEYRNSSEDEKGRKGAHQAGHQDHARAHWKETRAQEEH